MTARRLPGPGGLAQLGYLRRLLADPVPVLDELSRTYGPMIVAETDAAIDRLEAALPSGDADLLERPQAYLESPLVKQVPHPFPFTTRAEVTPRPRSGCRHRSPSLRHGGQPARRRRRDARPSRTTRRSAP